jgi:hypothetical protein
MNKDAIGIKATIIVRNLLNYKCVGAQKRNMTKHLIFRFAMLVCPEIMYHFLQVCVRNVQLNVPISI